MATRTWESIDKIIKMKYDGIPVSISELEKALAAGDDVKLKDLVLALRGPHGKYTASIYLFGGVRLSPEMHKKRCKTWYEGDELLHHCYTQAVTKQKEVMAEGDIKAELEKEMKEKAKIEEELRKAEALVDAIEADELSATEEGGFFPTFDEHGEVEAETVKEVDADGNIIDATKLKRKAGTSSKPKKSKPTINIRDSIKFDILKLEDDYSSFVPVEDDHYEFPSWTLEFTKLLDRGMNMWLYGGTGSGKSSLVEQVGAIGKMSVIYQSFHEDIKPDSLFGGKELVDGNTIWQDGPVTKAYREGHILLLDEIDGTPPEILFCLFSILDRKPLILADNACEIIQPHPNFRVVATGNTLGRGDETGSYSGTNVLNKAFLNRFRVWYNVEYPSQEVYKKIIMNEGVSEATAKVIARLAKEINAGAANGTLTETFSLRDAREVAKAAEILEGDIRRALQLTLLNRLGNTEQAAINEIYIRLVPEEME